MPDEVSKTKVCSTNTICPCLINIWGSQQLLLFHTELLKGSLVTTIYEKLLIKFGQEKIYVALLVLFLFIAV